jgi:hypothetical protein
MERSSLEGTENDEAILAVILAIVVCNQRLLTEEYRNYIFKVDSVLFEIGGVLLLVPFERTLM